MPTVAIHGPALTGVVSGALMLVSEGISIYPTRLGFIYLDQEIESTLLLLFIFITDN